MRNTAVVPSAVQLSVLLGGAVGAVRDRAHDPPDTTGAGAGAGAGAADWGAAAGGLSGAADVVDGLGAGALAVELVVDEEADRALGRRTRRAGSRR